MGRNHYSDWFGIESAQVEEAVNKEEALATVGVSAVGGRSAALESSYFLPELTK